MSTAPVRAHRDERGIALTELAFVSVMLLAMLGAAVDLGLGWKSGLAINEAARTGARVGSGQADDPGADYYALTGVKASLATAGKLDGVQRVVVYRASPGGGGSRVPSSCLAPTPSGACNVLTGAQFRALDLSSFELTRATPDAPPAGSGCLRKGAASLRNWCPNVRERRQTWNPDRYGIYIEYRHENLFPVMGATQTVTKTAVMRLEPPPL